MLHLNRIIGFASMWFAAGTVWAVDYNVSATLANTITGPNAFTFAISAGTPFNIPNGDTLTIDNASLGAGITLGAGQYLIGLSGNNKVTVNTGKNITANFNVGTSGYIFQPTGNGSSSIVVQSGATLATTGGVTANHSLYKSSSSVQTIMVQNLGTINSNIAADLESAPNNVVSICGSAPPTISGTLNTAGASVGKSYLYIGGYVDSTNTDQLQATTFTYSNPSKLNPYFYVRVMQGSIFNLQADIPTSTALPCDTWVVDSGATLNLQASNATVNESLTTNNFRNFGTTAISSGANAKWLTVNNLLNQSVLSLNGNNVQVNGFGASPSINNSSLGVMTIGAFGGAAIVQNFTLLTNAGALVVDGTIKNIITIKNTTGAIITFDPASTYDTITTINNDTNAIINFNNATSTNNGNLTLNNNGTVNLQAGNFGALSLVNNGVVDLTGGNLGATALTAVSDIENNQNGQIIGTAGQIGVAAQNYIPNFRNYGVVNLTSVPAVITKLTNYGSFTLASSSLTVTTFANLIGSVFTLTNATTVALGASITNYGEMDLNGVAAFNSIIVNDGLVNVSGNVTMQAVTNNQNFNILLGSVYNAGGTTFINNENLTVSGAALTMTALSNAQGANAVFSSVSAAHPNAFTGNINSSGIVNFNGTFNHTGAYVGDANSTLIVSGITNYNGNNAITQNGIFQSNITDDNNFGQLISNQNVSLANGTIVLNIHNGLVGTHTFNILTTTGAATITAAPHPFNNIDNFLYKVDVDTTTSNKNIKVTYNRLSLTDVPLTDNSAALAQAIETIYSASNDTNQDLDSLMSSLLTYAKDAEDVEQVLQQVSPIPLAPSQSLSIQRNLDHLLSERMLSTVVAYNSGSYTDSFSMWLRGIYSKHKQKIANDIVGYRFSTKGFILGAEARTENGSYLGMSLAITRSGANKLDDTSLARTKTWQITAYSQNYWTKQFFRNLVFGITNNDISQIKVVNFPTYNKNSYSNYDWQNFFFKSELGYAFNILDTYRFIPKGSAKGVYLKGYSYQEYGGGNGVDLSVSTSPVYALDIGVGASFVADLLLFNQQFQPQISVSMTYNLLHTPYVITSSFVNSLPFTNKIGVSRFGTQIGAGAKYIIDEELELDFSYNFDYYQSFTGRTWQLQAKYNF